MIGDENAKKKRKEGNKKEMAKGKRGVKLCTNALFKLAHFFFPGAPNWSKCARMRDALLLGFVLLLFCEVCYAYLLF